MSSIWIVLSCKTEYLTNVQNILSSYFSMFSGYALIVPVSFAADVLFAPFMLQVPALCSSAYLTPSIVTSKSGK